MTLPTDGVGIISYLALLVPGVIFISVRAQFRGFRDVDRSVGARLLLAFIVSVIFDAIYVAIFGPIVVERMQSRADITAAETAAAAWLFVALGLAIPALVSWLIYGDAPFADLVPSTAGVWVAVRDDYLVEWLHDAHD